MITKLTARAFKTVIQILGVLMVMGGLIRVLANQNTFDLIYMGHLWSDHQYFIYIYKVLGAFVIFTGASFIKISTDIHKFQSLLKAWQYLFIMIGLIMIFAGFASGIHPVFFIPDFIFCFLIGALLFFKPSGN